jgi:hypothetical protein
MFISPVLGKKSLKNVSFKGNQMPQASLACISQSASETNVGEPNCHSPVIISLPVLECVCESIGTHWKDLARNLSIPEGDIDEIDQFSRKLQDRAYEVCEVYEVLAYFTGANELAFAQVT